MLPLHLLQVQVAHSSGPTHLVAYRRAHLDVFRDLSKTLIILNPITPQFKTNLLSLAQRTSGPGLGFTHLSFLIPLPFLHAHRIPAVQNLGHSQPKLFHAFKDLRLVHMLFLLFFICFLSFNVYFRIEEYICRIVTWAYHSMLRFGL